MIIQIQNAGICFQEILKLLTKPEDTVIIFVAFDVDALCTLRILCSILKHYNKNYTIFPVISFDQMEMKINESEGSNSKAFIMINCGGSKDLTKYWFAEKDNMACILLDSHRPIHHNNVHYKKNIIVIDDGHCNFQNCPTDEEFKNTKIFDDDDDAENKIEEDEEEEEEDEENLYEEEKKIEEIEIVEESKESVGENSNTIHIKTNKEKRTLDEKKLKNEYKIQCQNRFTEYYSGTYFGYPACFPAVEIAIQSNLESNEIIWLNIISVTYHYLYSHISTDIYEQLYNRYKNYVMKLSKNYFKNETKKKAKKDVVVVCEEEKKDPYEDIELKSENRETKSIIIENDYKLFLYRHWTLYDSIRYSNYTLKNLHTYTEEGQRDIQKILAYLGIPLEETKQKFSYMKNEYKALFKEKIREVFTKFEMKDFIFKSFLYQFDQKTQVSASDIVYCASSLLEYPFNISLLEEDSGGSREIPDKNSIKEEDKSYFSANNMDYKYNNFWHCYNFLSLKDVKNLEISLELSMKFQKAMVNVGTSIKRIVPVKSFRWSIMNNDINDDVKYFQHPLSLEKLALFVLETQNAKLQYKSNQAQNINKPYVLAMLNNVKNTYLVAGVLSPTVQEDREKNTFPIRFRLAANKINAKVIFNNFNDNIIEIPKDTYMAFIEELCTQD